MDCYNLQGILGSIDKEIDIEESAVSKWQAVTFPTKKDGKPFAQMGKNIVGARYNLESYAMQPGEYELTVTSWTKTSGWQSDTIKAHSLVKYLKDETMKAKTANYMPKQTYLEQVYRYDLDDIKAAIAARIERGKERIVALKKQRADAEKAFNDFLSAYQAALKNLSTVCGKDGDSTLYYNVLDTVEKHGRYI